MGSMPEDATSGGIQTVSMLTDSRLSGSLVRFVAVEDGAEHLGEPVDDSLDVGAASTDGQIIEVRAFTGSSVLSPDIRPTSTTFRIARLLPSLAKSEMGTLRCIGLNYRKHAKEMNLELPEHPTLFFKPSISLGSPNAPLMISYQATDDQADYEAELAVVIGMDTRSVFAADVMEYVLGHSCSNNVTARTHQFHGAQWGFGKGFDGFCPLEPTLVAAHSNPNPGDIELKTVLNGETRQLSLTNDMIFSISEVVAYLSQGTTLEASTVIMTGTPHGIGVSKVPKVFLKLGDDLRIVMSHGLGSLVTPVEYESAPRATKQINC